MITGRPGCRVITIFALTLGLGALLLAQDEGKKKVEQPLKRTFGGERPILEAAKSAPPAKYDLAKTGIEWHKGLESVLNKGKPILLLQILGNYDDVYC